MREVVFHNHQRDCRVDCRFFRQVARWLLDEALGLPGYSIEVSLLGDAAMTQVNEGFLQHAGSTDVITFDYSALEGSGEKNCPTVAGRSEAGSRQGARAAAPREAPRAQSANPNAQSAILGELLLCPAEARRQARRFGTTWQSELVRYFAHGMLHLLGHDDRSPAPRRRMKRVENRLVRAAEERFSTRRLARSTPRRP